MPTYAPSWERRYSRKLVWTDTAVVVCSVALGLAVSHPSVPQTVSEPDAAVEYRLQSAILVAVIYVLAWLIALSVYDTRQPALFGTGPDEYNRVLTSTLMAYGIVTVFLFMLDEMPGRTFVFASLPLGLGLLLVGRWLWRKRLHFQRRRNRNTYRTLLIGERRKCVHTAKQLRGNVLAGFEIVGAVTFDNGARDLMPEIPIVADYKGVLQAVEQLDIDTLIVSGDDTLTPRRVRKLGWELESRHVDMVLATALTDVAGPRIHARPVSGLPLIHVDYPQFRGWRYFAKRFLDLLGSTLGIVLLSPVMLLLGLLIKLDSRGPVIFKQERLGLRGRPFTMYKFRSMLSDAEDRLPTLLDQSDGNTMMFKMHDDPRVTRLGRFIRKHSIDEIPQLFNVFLGDMSMVGPRPPLQHEAEAYEEWVSRRLFVRPGISGLWQVSGRSNLTWDESVRIDLYYVENWSIMGDLLILWRTLRTIVRGDGAY